MVKVDFLNQNEKVNSFGGDQLLPHVLKNFIKLTCQGIKTYAHAGMHIKMA